MNEKKRTAIDALNEMFWRQSVEFRENYRENYFVLLEYITETDKGYATHNELRQKMREKDRLEKIASIK